MRRILLILTVALVMAAMMVASIMPAFAQGRGEGAQGEAVGPEGGNPGVGTQQETAGASGNKPLPFGGQDPEEVPGRSDEQQPSGLDAGLANAPGGVVCTAPGSPFFNPELSPPCPE